MVGTGTGAGWVRGLNGATSPVPLTMQMAPTGWLGAPCAHPAWGEVGHCTQPHSLPNPAAALYKMGALTGSWGSRPKPCCPYLWGAIEEPSAWVSPGQTLSDGT